MTMDMSLGAWYLDENDEFKIENFQGSEFTVLVFQGNYLYFFQIEDGKGRIVESGQGSILFDVMRTALKVARQIRMGEY